MGSGASRFEIEYCFAQMESSIPGRTRPFIQVVREGRVTQGKLVLESIITELDVEISRFQRVGALLANEGPKRSRPAKNLSCRRQTGSAYKTLAQRRESGCARTS